MGTGHRLLCFCLCGVALSVNAQVTVQFREGALPSGTYAGAESVSIHDGRNTSITSNNLWVAGTGAPFTSSALLRFDLSSLPSWATLLNAQLELFVEDASSESFLLLDSLRPWVEGQATFQSYDGTQLWMAEGALGPADQGAVPHAEFLPTQVNTLYAASITPVGLSQMQRWVAGDFNAGWVLSNASSVDPVGFSSGAHSQGAQRPRLTLSYWEGRLALLSSTQRSEVSESSVALSIDRQTIDGLPISLGAPTLSVRLRSSSATGEFARAGSGPWTPELTVSIPPGQSRSSTFFYRDSTQGNPILSATGTPAWQVGRLSWGVGMDPGPLPPENLEPPAEAPATPAPSVPGTCAGEGCVTSHPEPLTPQDLAVGCSCTQSSGLGPEGFFGALLLLAAVIPRRQRGDRGA